jgi:hypothetical protein
MKPKAQGLQRQRQCTRATISYLPPNGFAVRIFNHGNQAASIIRHLQIRPLLPADGLGRPRVMNTGDLDGQSPRDQLHAICSARQHWSVHRGRRRLGRFCRFDLSCRSNCRASRTPLQKLGVDCCVYRAAGAAAGVLVPELARQERRPCLRAPKGRDDGFNLYQNRSRGWPGDTYPWCFSGSAEGRNHCHCDLHRRRFDPSLRGPLKIKPGHRSNQMRPLAAETSRYRRLNASLRRQREGQDNSRGGDLVGHRRLACRAGHRISIGTMKEADSRKL